MQWITSFVSMSRIENIMQHLNQLAGIGQLDFPEFSSIDFMLGMNFLKKEFLLEVQYKHT